MTVYMMKKYKTGMTSDILEYAVARNGCTSRVSISPAMGTPTNVEVRQASAASNSAGHATVGSVGNQGTTPGRKTGSETATATGDEDGHSIDAFAKVAKVV